MPVAPLFCPFENEHFNIWVKFANDVTFAFCQQHSVCGNNSITLRSGSLLSCRANYGRCLLVLLGRGFLVASSKLFFRKRVHRAFIKKRIGNKHQSGKVGETDFTASSGNKAPTRAERTAKISYIGTVLQKVLCRRPVANLLQELFHPSLDLHLPSVHLLPISNPKQSSPFL